MQSGNYLSKGKITTKGNVIIGWHHPNFQLTDASSYIPHGKILFHPYAWNSPAHSIKIKQRPSSFFRSHAYDTRAPNFAIKGQPVAASVREGDRRARFPFAQLEINKLLVRAQHAVIRRITLGKNALGGEVSCSRPRLSCGTPIALDGSAGYLERCASIGQSSSNCFFYR